MEMSYVNRNFDYRCSSGVVFARWRGVGILTLAKVALLGRGVDPDIGTQIVSQGKDICATASVLSGVVPLPFHADPGKETVFREGCRAGSARALPPTLG